jgi:2-oxoglutarate ferredoxin oxidoreductase subunit alpha
MARAQGDYWQATRGGGHGDYRHLVFAPVDAAEAVELIPRAFHLAAAWRNPVVILGDYYLAHTARAVDVTVTDYGALPPAEWALTGESGGSGHAKVLSFLGSAKQRDGAGYDLAVHYADCAEHTARMLRDVPAQAEGDFVEDADVTVVAFGTPAAYVRAAVRELRAEGVRVGWIRPVTLVPFPFEAVADAARQAKAVAVFENNTGQMLDDVRLAVLGAAPVEFIGGLSLDASGFGIAPDLDVGVVRRRILDVVERAYD